MIDETAEVDDEYLEWLKDFLEDVLPPDTAFAFVAELLNDKGEPIALHILHTATDNAELAKSLRAVARKLEGDA